MRSGIKLIHGVGVNNANYHVTWYEDGRRVICPIYSVWRAMIRRCYSEKHHAKARTYIGCSVCPEWLTFSNFKDWMSRQDWKGKEIDKDILVKGNKVYSPENCAFVCHVTNRFVEDSASTRGKYPVGVSFNVQMSKVQSNCGNPFTNKREYLGLFDCQNEAHLAWKKRKHELALQLADLQDDDRVAAALRLRYA